MRPVRNKSARLVFVLSATGKTFSAPRAAYADAPPAAPAVKQGARAGPLHRVPRNLPMVEVRP